MIRTALAAVAFAAATIATAAFAGEKPAATLYKNPQCTCCEGYADYLRQNGYAVTVKPTHDLTSINRQFGVPEKLEGCHTTVIGGYVVEVHVPIKTFDRLITERPNIRGISLPGMPAGSPGMTGRKTGRFTIYELSNGPDKVYAVE
jgi:hypothetical protein